MSAHCNFSSLLLYALATLWPPLYMLGNHSFITSYQCQKSKCRVNMCTTSAEQRTLNERAIFFPHQGQFLDIPGEVHVICFGALGSTDLDEGTNRLFEKRSEILAATSGSKRGRYC